MICLLGVFYDEIKDLAPEVIENVVLIPMWFYDLLFLASDGLKKTNCDL